LSGKIEVNQETFGGNGASVAGRITAVSIVDAIAADLRARIFSGDLGSGHTLTETDVASTY
jgi:DNA-binding GntR family transcriptional regulator